MTHQRQSAQKQIGRNSRTQTAVAHAKNANFAPDLETNFLLLGLPYFPDYKNECFFLQLGLGATYNEKLIKY